MALGRVDFMPHGFQGAGGYVEKALEDGGRFCEQHDIVGEGGDSYSVLSGLRSAVVWELVN